MKNMYLNLTQMLQGCSKRNGMTVSASKPDGEPTVNRQSRLMSLSGKKAEKEQLSPSCLLSASFPLSFRSRYLRYAAVIFCVLVMSIANIGTAWGAASTSSDGKTASGTITFSEVGTLSQQTTYWYNGLKFYEQSTNSMSADKAKRWSAAITPCQYGTFTAGENWQAGAYDMTGLILQAHCLAINVSSACTIEIIVNMSGKTLGQSNPVVPGNLKVFWDGTEYGTAYTSSNYTNGTAKTDTTWEQNINGKYNRMKLSIPVSAEDLAAKSIDVIKVSYTGSATGTPGYSCAFVYESVKIVPAGGGGDTPCFSATINKSSDSYSVSGNSSKDITSDATVTSGGAVTCVNYNASSKSFNFSSNGVSPGTSDGYVQFSLPSGSTLTTGSVIRVQGYADNAAGGLLLIDDDGTTVASQTNNGALDFSYTVTAGSAINGLNHIRLKRARTSGTNAVKTVTISGCGATPASTWKFKYSGDSWEEHIMDEADGVASYSIDLDADTRYEFGFDDNGYSFYKNGGTILSDISGWTFNTTDNNCKIHTGPAGTYTFAINTTTKAVTVTYPTVTHPNSHYAYYKNRTSWSTVYGYMYGDGDIKSAAWPGCPLASTVICGTTYYWMAANDMSSTYTHIIFNNGGSGEGNQTWNLPISGSGAHYNDYQDDDWYALTYTISFDKGTGTSGTMSSITDICPNADQLLPANTFEKTGYTFNCWHADKATKVGGSAIAIGGDIAGGATLQEINNDITLTAQWAATNYTLSYNLNGGSVTPANPTSYTIESSDITLNNPTKTGYTFAGWTGTGLDAATTAVIIAAGSTGNRSYTATWTPIVPTSVSLDKSSTTITEGGTETLTATISPMVVANNTITWSTSDADVATVDDGVVTAVAAGTATITATTHNGKTATCEVTVAPAVTYTVTYEYNEATSGDETESNNGNPLPNPSKTGYSLVGWYASDGTFAGAGGATTYVPDADITLYAQWQQDACAGGGGGGSSTTSVIFKASNKNDAGNAFDEMANGDTQLVGSGIAKLIAANSVALNDDANKYGYRFDGSRLYIVFKFNGETDLTIYHNANSTGERYASLYSFSSDKALKDIVSTDWSTKSQKAYTSVSSTSTWEGGQSSVVTTNDAKTTWNYTTKGCLTVTWEDLSAGYYVMDGTGSEAYIYGFSADVAGGGSPTCYYVTYNGNGADGGYTTDEASHPSGSNVTVKTNSFTKTGYTFNGWKTEPSGGTSYAAGGTISSIAGNMTLYAQWEEEEDETTYYLVTSTAQLNATDTYIIANSAGTAVMSTTTADTNKNPDDITSGFSVDGSTLTVTSASPNLFKLTSATNGWLFKGGNGSGNYISSDGTPDADLWYNTSSTPENNTGEWAVSFASGIATMKLGKADETTYHIYYDATNTKFIQSTTASNIKIYTSAAPVPCTAAPTVTEGSNSSVTSTTATVSCASGISALGTGGCTITEYGFVIGESANPEIGGSGVTKHVVGTTYTTTGTLFSKDLTGLTASTTYYVCPYATNGYGTAYGTQTSFTTLAAGATPIVSWDLKVNANWVDVDGTSNNASITDPETSTFNITVTTANLANKTDKLELSSNGSRYVEFTFDVACGKKLTPDSIVMQVLNVGGSSGGKMTHKAELSDSYGHKISGTVQPSTDGSLTKLKVTNGDKVYFQGAVSLKVWAWNHDGTNGTAFRMGQDVDIYGAVGDQATPTATITWTKQPAGGLSGTNETVTAVSSDGSAVTITSNNGSVATVAGSTVSYVGVGSTYLTASGTDACGNTMVSVNSDNFTVIGAYNLSYNANTGTGTMTGETGVHYAVVAENDFTAPDGKTFFEWNTAADGSGDSYHPGDAIELSANTTLYAQWGTELTATWSVTKVDSKLYRGGGGYSVTVYLNQADWDASGDKDALELTATEGVTLKNIVKSINGSDQAQVTADFDITTGVDADATSITFTLSVPAAGAYGSAELTHDEDLTDCTPVDGEVYYSYTISSTSAVTNAKATGGTFTAYNNGGTLGSGSGFYTLADNGISKAYFLINTTNTIAIGDKISVTTNNQKYKVYTADGAEVADNVSTYYTVVAEDGIAGTNSFKIGRYNSDNKTFKTFTVTSAGGSGGETPTLSWTPALESDAAWNSTESRLDKETGDADFTFTATQDKNSLGAITYSSNNTAVATVNATTGKVHIVGAEGDATITATLAASGCFDKATATYTIHVTNNCSDEPGTITSRDLGCDGTELTVSGHTATASVSYQWYKDGVNLGSSYTNPTCTVTVAGEYYVVVTNTGTGHCAMASTNTVTVDAKTAISVPTNIVDSWYVKNGRRTPDIALWKTTGVSTFTVKNNAGGATIENIGGCTFELKDGIIYLKGTTSTGAAPSGMEAGDLVIKVEVKDECGSNTKTSSTITIHRQAATDRPSIAFVVDGTKGSGFSAVSADHSTNSPLYEFLDYTAGGGEFDLTACNIYSTTDEKAIRQEYSKYDAILITDDPSTNTVPTGVSGKEAYKTKGYVNAFGTMVDVRPILTMEAYVSALANWKTKGIAGNPLSPNPRQYALRLECKDHEIYKEGLPNPAPGTHVWDEVIDGQTYRNVILVDSTKSPYTNLAYNEQTAGNQSPALQGFDGTASGSLLGLGRISNGSLQAAIERQEEPAARLLVFSIQAKALPNALTEEGKIVIKNILRYLLKTNMEEVDDCSNYFTGGASGTDTDWNKASNWSKTELPSSEAKVRILAPCVIADGTIARVSQIDIAVGGKSTKKAGEINGSLTVNAGGSLIVGGKIRKAEAPHFGADDLMPMDDPSKLIINTGSTAQAALIFDNDDADTKATVNLYSLGRKIDSKYQFQYFAVPMEYVAVNPSFAGSGIYTYVWHENGGWERRGYYTDLYAFEGVGITTASTSPRVYTMTGNLASTATKEITLTKDDGGENIIGNSWTAPINIASLVDAFAEDENVEKVVYIYITGNDNMVGAQSSTEVAGKWLAIPIDASGWRDWTGQKVIPAMQAFYIKATSETTLTMDYNSLVRTTPEEQLNKPLKAPLRAPVSGDAISMLKLRVEDSSTYTDLYMFESSRFSDSYDNGWEAKQMGGDGYMQLYAQNKADKMAVLATDELEGTIVGFEPGKETVYTISFSGAGNGYYLNDVKMQTSTLISEENTYSFEYEAGDDANRFYISRTPLGAPGIATGVTDLDADAPKVQKIIYNDKLYIIRGGKVFSADGQLVK